MPEHRILFVIPPNILYEDFVDPPQNVGSVLFLNSKKRYGSLITDIPLGVIFLSAYLKSKLNVLSRAVDFNVQLPQEFEFDC